MKVVKLKIILVSTKCLIRCYFEVFNHCWGSGLFNFAWIRNYSEQYTNFRYIFSFSCGIEKLSYLCRNLINPICAYKSASCLPMHDLGPALKPM